MSAHTSLEKQGDFTVTPRVLLMALMAIAIGLLSTVVAFVLLRLINLFTNLFYFQRWSTAAASPAQNMLGGYSVLVPIVGALIIGLMARYGSERIRGHGIPEALESILINGSRVQPPHAKSGALLAGGDLLKAAYAHWLQGDLPGADKIFNQYLNFRTQQKDVLIPWRQAVWEYSTGRQPAAMARLSNITGPAANVATAQLALWKDPSKLPQDPVALKQAYERTPPAADGLARVLYAAALAKAGQKVEANKLLALWPIPGVESDPLLQSFVFPKYLELKQELK